MQELAEEFVRQRKEHGIRVSAEMREMAVRYARWALAEQNQPLYESARVLGIRRKTLRNWRLGRRSRPAATMCEVVVPASPVQETAGLTLVTPDGFRIEGLSAEAAVTLMESLR